MSIFSKQISTYQKLVSHNFVSICPNLAKKSHGEAEDVNDDMYDLEGDDENEDENQNEEIVMLYFSTLANCSTSGKCESVLY